MKASYADIIDRVLDKGVVIDVHSRLFVSGIDIFTGIDARFVVVSLETSLTRRAEVLAALRPPRRAFSGTTGVRADVRGSCPAPSPEPSPAQRERGQRRWPGLVPTGRSH